MLQARTEYKHRPYRTERSARGFYFFCAQLLVVVVTSGWLMRNLANFPFMQFRTITIEGNQAVATDAIRRVALAPTEGKIWHIWRRDNIGVYSPASVEKEIFALDPRIATVDVKANRTTIAVRVREYQPTYRYCVPKSSAQGANVSTSSVAVPNSATSSSVTATSSTASSGGEQLTAGAMDLPQVVPVTADTSDCYWADERGYVFAKAPDYSGSPMLTISENDTARIEKIDGKYPLQSSMFAPSELDHLVGLIEQLHANDYGVREIVRLPAGDILIDVGYPWSVAANLSRDPTETVGHLVLVLNELGSIATSTSSQLKDIDLRFGNKVFYK